MNNNTRYGTTTVFVQHKPSPNFEVESEKPSTSCCREKQPGAADQRHLMNLSSLSVSTSIKAEVLAVCWSGAFTCVLTQCQNASAAILGKHINLGRIISKLFGVHHAIVRKIIHVEFIQVENIRGSCQSSHE